MADTTLSPPLDAIRRKYLTDAFGTPIDIGSGYATGVDSGGTGSTIDTGQAIQPQSLSMPASSTPSNTTNPQPDPMQATSQGLGQFGDYDPTYENAMAGYSSQENEMNQQYNSAVNNLNTQYLPQQQQLGQNYQDQLQSLQAQMAQQGILRSSNNLYGQGQIGTQYQNELGGLTNAQQSQQAQLADQRNQLLQQLGLQRGQAEQAHASFLSNVAQQRAAQQAQTEANQQSIQQQQDWMNQTGLNAMMQAGQVGTNPLLQASPTGQLSPGVNPDFSPQSISSNPKLSQAYGVPYQEYNGPTQNAPWNVGKPTQEQFNAEPQWQQQGFASESQANPQISDIAMRLMDQYNQGISQYGDNPDMMNQARQSLGQAAQSNPDLSFYINQSPLFDAIRRRLGM